MFEKIENSSLKRRIKNHVIGRGHDFFAVVQPGFEKISGGELAGPGLLLKDNFIEGGVEFSGKLDSCYRASLLSRTASRIMMRISTFRSGNFFELERLIRSFPWELYVMPETEIRFRASTAKSMIYHTGKLEEIFETGIEERFVNIDTDRKKSWTSDIQTIFLRNQRDLCTVSLDASGEFLYKRGSGKNITRATLRETTAALILIAAGIHSYEQILDPMCGSGTFSIEAASILTDTPPALGRKFSFMNWPCFKESTFRFIKEAAIKNIIPQEMVKQKIFTSDIDSKAVNIARSNIPETFSKMIDPEVRDFFSLSSDIVKDKKTLIVLNPPYGKRIEEGNGVSVYSEIGRKIRKDFANCGYIIIVPGHEKETELKLDFNRKIFFMNGGIKAAVLFRDV